MALECFTWTTKLLGALLYTICKGEEDLGETIGLSYTICKGEEDFGETFGRLPDGLIIDILGRLPTNSLVSCRRVCRDWRDLITLQYLTTLDLGRARPMLFIEDNSLNTENHGRRNLYVIGENLNRQKVFKKVHLRPDLMINKRWKNLPFLMYSCQGVLLFSDWRLRSTYYVLNPITEEEVIVQHTLHPGRLCALYFCPLTREFKLLYAQEQGSCCQYLVYMFKTQTWTKIDSSSFNFMPCHFPAIVNGALHWIIFRDLGNEGIPPCANGIMIFNMGKEELSTMPRPGSVCNSENGHLTMTLLVKDDCLAFCQLLVYQYTVDIWILEDYETRRWTKRYRVNLSDETIFPFRLPYSTIHSDLFTEVCLWLELLSIQDGELLFYLNERGLFLYNLDHKTVKRIEGLQGEMFIQRYHCMPYVKSLLAIA